MKRSSQSKLNKALADLSLDAPQVIIARTLQLWQFGPLSSARDQAEFTRMFAEKQAAAAESCLSLMMDAAAMSQRMFFGLLPQVSTRAAAESMHRALKPYQRRASANARRLGGGRKSR